MKTPGRDSGVLSEINVTPFVDVMLVLLIIFMVSAPLMQSGVNVDLPKSKAGAVSDASDRATLVLRGNRQIELNQKAVSKSELQARLKTLVGQRPDLQVLVHADKDLSYGFVAEIMGEVRSANVLRLGLMTEPPTDGP